MVVLLSSFEKILVPLDGSDHSKRALEAAIRVAERFKGGITLVHIYSSTVTPLTVPEPTTLTPSGAPVVTSAEISRILEASREIGKKILQDGAQKTKSYGISVETELREGSNVQEIVKTANEGKFDLIVVGVKGVSKIRELLLGSVSLGIVKHAPCPVLVVK
jgi:nucleotide-binding universal stress UspA family protein